MVILWILYWLLILSSLIFSVIVIFKKNKVLGISQFTLSLIVPVIALLFSLERDFSKNEVIYLLNEVVEGNTLAAMIIILYLVIIGLFIYNLLSFRKKKVDGEEDEGKGKDAKK